MNGQWSTPTIVLCAPTSNGKGVGSLILVKIAEAISVWLFRPARNLPYLGASLCWRRPLIRVILPWDPTTLAFSNLHKHAREHAQRERGFPRRPERQRQLLSHTCALAASSTTAPQRVACDTQAHSTTILDDSAFSRLQPTKATEPRHKMPRPVRTCLPNLWRLKCQHTRESGFVLGNKYST